MKIALQQVTKRFGTTVAVAEASLEIPTGECFFLLGPSGCGKTTLLRMIAGFCRPDAGAILFDDRPVTDLPPHRRQTGMVFQNYALWPHLTVFDNVAFGLTVPGRTLAPAARRERVGRLLETVRMADYADRKPNQLSGGQQQRVALARALAIEPGCLLLDEPLSNLDAKLRAEMRGEIRRLVKTLGLTAVYVTHDQQEALSMADRCAVMRDGRIEQIGAPRALYENPINRFVADFIGGANLLPGTLLARDAETARIHTVCGEWQGICRDRALATGQPVVLAVRPDSIRWAPSEFPCVNGYEGRVVESMYYGDLFEVRLALTDGLLLKARHDTRAAATALQPGATVRFHVDPADVTVLAASDPEKPGV